MTFENQINMVLDEMARLKSELQCANDVGDVVLQGFVEWAMFGWKPGGFLTACLENNFLNAATKADSTNITRLREIALLLYNGMPRGSWGSPERVKAWRGTHTG